MTQTAAGSTIGFQLNPVTISGTTGSSEGGLPVDANYIGLATIRTSLSPIVDIQASPFELSSGLHPTDTFYKASEMVAGQVVFVPRLKDTFPRLLAAMMGDVSTTGADITETGVYSTVFKFPDGSTSQFADVGNTIKTKDYIPWLSFVTVLPDGDFGTLAEDCVIPSMQINIPQTGPLNVTMPIIGKKGKLNDGQNYTVSTPDTFESVPVSGNGSFKIGGVEHPITGARISLINSTTTPKEELVVGNYHPDTFTTRRRAATIEFTYKWVDGALAEKILSNGAYVAGELDFDAVMPASSSFDATFDAPGRYRRKPALHYHIHSTFYATSVKWMPNGPIVPDLNGDDILMQNWVGTVLDDGTNDYLTATVRNSESNALTAYKASAA